jgi:hypothetical protein
MAGFSCDAQRRYRIGEPQNVFGTAAAMGVVIVQFGGGGGRAGMEVCKDEIRLVVTTQGSKRRVLASKTLSREACFRVWSLM